MNNHPYISFVIAARNDDYGKNFLHRMKVCVSTLLELSENNSLNAELIVVEWNPPKDKQFLAQAIPWPTGLKSTRVRIITVPLDVHNKISGSERLPMFEFLAKNVGIRRAKGEYVLITNPDIVFDENIITFLASKELSPNYFYRIDRHDVKKMIPLELTAKEKILFCENNWTEVKTMIGDRSRKFPYINYNYLLSILSIIKSKFIYDPRPNFHTNAAGDFFLMANSEWQKLRAYPEIPIPSFVDSYMCFIAASSGLIQTVFKDKGRIYHQSHSSHINRVNYYKEYETFKERAKEMMRSKKPFIMNDENWGLAEETLKEYGI